MAVQILMQMLLQQVMYQILTSNFSTRLFSRRKKIRKRILLFSIKRPSGQEKNPILIPSLKALFLKRPKIQNSS